MAGDYREVYRDLDKIALPEYNLNLINQNLDSLPDPLGAVQKILEARKKREANDRQQRERNRVLREQLTRNHEALALQDREAAEAEQNDIPPPAAAPDDIDEPEITEPLCLAPSQPLPIVDLSLLGLPSSRTHAEAMALLQQLMFTGQLFAYAGAFDNESASPLLRTLFNIVAYGENPFGAYQQLFGYYQLADGRDIGWVPQLQDFLTAILTLGYQPPRGHHHGGGDGVRKRSAVLEGPSPQEAGTSASGSGGGGGGGWTRDRLFNLQGLLRLMADLSALHLRDKVDMGFGIQGQAAGKGLITALLRMLLDSELSSRLHADVCAALEGLMQPWDEMLWRRVCDDAAVTASELGPSHRAAYRVISGTQGLSERLRTWQQCAALQLLRRTLPQDVVGGSGGASGGHHGQVDVDLRQVRKLLGVASASSVRTLLSGLGRSPREGGRRAADYWRLLTVLQCAHLVVWNAAYVAEGGETEETVRWITGYFKCVEQFLRGQQATVMRIKVFLAGVQTNYELLGRAGE